MAFFIWWIVDVPRRAGERGAMSRARGFGGRTALPWWDEAAL
ncbi:hypothetical protein [Asaia sp. VD9]